MRMIMYAKFLLNTFQSIEVIKLLKILSKGHNSWINIHVSTVMGLVNRVGYG